VVERRLASTLCKARAASRDAEDTALRHSAFRFPFLFFLHFVGQSTDREATGHHRRHSLAKIGAEGGEIGSLNNNSDANRIARTIPYVVIAGLDPNVLLFKRALWSRR
jgi:hypothetical protein